MRNEADPPLTHGLLRANARRGRQTAEWDSLPLHVQLQQRLADLLVLVDGLRSEFHTEEANPLLWVEPEVEKIFAEVDATTRKLAN